MNSTRTCNSRQALLECASFRLAGLNKIMDVQRRKIWYGYRTRDIDRGREEVPSGRSLGPEEVRSTVSTQITLRRAISGGHRFVRGARARVVGRYPRHRVPGEVTMPARISSGELLSDIRRLSDKLGRVPRCSDVREHGKYSISVYQDRFGSWSKARSEAGVGEPDGQKDAVSREDLLSELQRLTEELGSVPTINDLSENGEFSKGPYSRVFGSWNSALEEAGLTPNLEQNISDSELLDTIREVADTVGGRPTTAHLQKHSKRCPSLYRDRFGSWKDALERAGFEPEYKGKSHHHTIPREQLLDEIHRLAGKLGRAPIQSDMVKQGKYSIRPYERAFGSWAAAKEKAGFEPGNSWAVNRDQPSRGDLLQSIQDLADELGRPPMQSDMKKDGPYSMVPFCRVFGSWSNAKQAAGFEPLRRGEHHPQWSGGHDAYERYGGDWQKQRRKARERDNYECIDCGMDEEDHKERFNKELEVHHLNAPENRDDGHCLDNLVTLCTICHNNWERVAPLTPDVN